MELSVACDQAHCWFQAGDLILNVPETHNLKTNFYCTQQIRKRQGKFVKIPIDGGTVSHTLINIYQRVRVSKYKNQELGNIFTMNDKIIRSVTPLYDTNQKFSHVRHVIDV